jgi:drug/metabolite transporter (DMT)-like permease
MTIREALPSKPGEAKSSNRYVGMVALGALCYSTLVIFARALDGLDAMSIAFFRALFAFLFFMVLLPRFSGPIRVYAYRPAIPRLILLGTLMGLTSSLYIFAIQYTSAANAALLVNSAPVYIALTAPLVLKEPAPKYTWLSLALVVPGMILITGVGEISLESQSFLGILAGMLSGFIFAGMLLVSRSLKGLAGGHVQSFWGTGISALVLLPWVLQTPGEAVRANLWLLALTGIITMGLASLLYYLSLQSLKTQVVSVVAILEPVFAATIGLVIFSEYLSPSGLLGGVMVIAGIYAISRT